MNIKLGPTSESNFDSVIHDFMRTLEIPFAFVWYNREVEKQIPYPDRLSFNDTKTKIQKKLSNSLLRKWTMEIFKPFIGKEKEDIITTTISIIQKINETAKEELPRLNTEGTWFMIFPPGECD